MSSPDPAGQVSPVELARRVLAGREAWLVGGTTRDRLLGRASADIDVVLPGDVEQAARALARAAPRAACFELSSEHRAWRVVCGEQGWQADLEPMRAATLEQDLRLRDFTVNAIAEPLSGGEPIDPVGGIEDLRAGRLRAASPKAFVEDPLRVMRLARVAVELDLEPEPETLALARTAAPLLAGVSAERVFAELGRILSAAQARRGIELLVSVGAGEAVLPELVRLRGIQQSRYHHADVYEHTLEVLDRTVTLTHALAGAGHAGAEPDAGADDGAGVVDAGAALVSTSAAAQVRAVLASMDGQLRARLASVLAEPLADELTRGQALAWGALLHDAAKPRTQGISGEGGRVTFIGHDVAGAELAREVLGRLRASERLRSFVAGLVRGHLRLGFLVHEPQPLSRRAVFGYLRACSPVEVDVTLLSIADRLATRGDRAKEAIDAHLQLAIVTLPDALDWHSKGPPAVPLRGDDLARELGIAHGPRLGELLEELLEARYAGDIKSRSEAVAYARELLAESESSRS
ncbi:MAG TPA: HD domain-containing protein [Solirubrobacteraceae bacterium]|nr:HD domain-containing protein [Solirubrobacteraceae bacterium]